MGKTYIFKNNWSNSKTFNSNLIYIYKTAKVTMYPKNYVIKK